MVAFTDKEITYLFLAKYYRTRKGILWLEGDRKGRSDDRAGYRRTPVLWLA